MYRSQRVITVRYALSATLLGCAALAHAASSPAGDDEQWTRVDLDNAPALIIGAKPGAGQSAQVVAASKKSVAGRKASASTAPPKTGASKAGAKQLAEPSSANATPTTPRAPSERATVMPTPGALEPAQPATAPTKGDAKVDTPKIPGVSKSASAIKVPESKAPTSFTLSPRDRTIRAGLERWTASAGWKLSWELDEKFQSGGVVRFDADFGADFDSALSKLAGAMRSEVKTHAYLYVGNKVLRVLEEPTKPVVQPAVPMTPVIPDGVQRDIGDRGLPYVTRVKGYWLGASGTESEDAPPQGLPPIFSASVSLIFSDKANLATVTGILSKVTGIAILLPGAIEYPANSLFINDTPASKKKTFEAQGKRTYVGTPRTLLDRISISTGMLWEYKDETIVFTY